MAVDKEYWNIPKTDELLSIPQSTNLTVFVDHADNALVWGLGASDVAAMTGVFMALIAIAVSVWQGVVSRKHNKLSVQPLLNYRIHMDAEIGRYEIMILNAGGGPAILKESCIMKGHNIVTLNDKENYSSEIGKAIEQSIVPNIPYRLRVNISGFSDITVIKSGETITIFLELEEATQVDPSFFSKHLADVFIQITYTGVYGKDKQYFGFPLGY